MHHFGLDRIDVAGEVGDEVVLREPRVAPLVDVQMGDRRSRRALREQGADRLALV